MQHQTEMNQVCFTKNIVTSSISYALSRMLKTLYSQQLKNQKSLFMVGFCFTPMHTILLQLVKW